MTIGQLKWFYDKFYPSRVDYSYTKFNKFLEFIYSFKDNYRLKLLHLLRKGNLDYEKQYSGDMSDDEIWADFKLNTEEAKFERTHFHLSRKEWEEALKEKEEFTNFLRNSDYIIRVYYNRNKSSSGIQVCFRIGDFIVVCTPNAPIEDLYDRMFRLRYNVLGRPKIYVGNIPENLIYTEKLV